MIGLGMLRLETRTSSWTYWRRPTHQNTGLSEFIRSRTCQTEEAAKKTTCTITSEFIQSVVTSLELH